MRLPLRAVSDKCIDINDSVILDAAARRFQAHKIYLRAAAAKRWALNRSNILRGQRPTPAHDAQLKAVSSTFHQVGLSWLSIEPWC